MNKGHSKVLQPALEGIMCCPALTKGVYWIPGNQSHDNNLTWLQSPYIMAKNW